MNHMHDSNCHFDGERTVSGQIICLSNTRMICKDGKWQKPHRIGVL